MEQNNLSINEQINKSTYIYRIQVGLFRNYYNALRLQEELSMQGYVSDIVSQGDLYVVHVGEYRHLDDAVILQQMLRRRGYNTLLVAV